MAASFKDHFSAHASAYARYRPRYPDALFAYLATLGPVREVAWDCGTGNGQAAHGLAYHFTQIVATDASADQVAHAVPHERITYHVTPASQCPLDDHTADLATVAQAVHWFPFDSFYAEVHRVLKPGGALALWTYGLSSITPAIDAVVKKYYADIVGPYWPPERQLVDEAYRTLPFPFEELAPPTFDMTLIWSLDDLLGFLGTWSATRRFIKENGADPIDQIKGELARAWGDASRKKPTQWPLYLRVGHTNPA